MYVNVGARYVSDRSDIPTKTALKLEVQDNPGNVELYETTMGKEHITHNPYNLDNGDVYSVTGPNPYTSRKWYANIQIGKNGTIVVK